MSMILIRVLHQHRRVRHTLAKSRFFLIERHVWLSLHCKKTLDATERGMVFVESLSQKHATTYAQTLNSAILLGWLVRCSRLAILSSIMLGIVYGILKVPPPIVRSISTLSWPGNVSRCYKEKENSRKERRLEVTLSSSNSSSKAVEILPVPLPVRRFYLPISTSYHK